MATRIVVMATAISNQVAVHVINIKGTIIPLICWTKYSRLILITAASCHICAPTCSFADAVALLRERLSTEVLCFLQLSDRAYVPGARCIGLFLL